LTSPSQPRNARTLPLIRARGLSIADNNPNPPDDADDQLNLLNLQGPRQDDPAPGNAAQVPQNGQQQQSAPDPATPSAQVKTIDDFMREVAARYHWFMDQQPEDKRIVALNSTTHIETYKLTDDGFQINVAGNNSQRAIRWIYTPAGTDGSPAQQLIQGQSDGFDLSDARAMVALSAVNGWNQINVHGNQHERDLLWFAAQEQGIKVLGYTPAADSDVYKQWQATHQDGDSAPPVINGGSSGPGPNVTSGPANQPSPPVQQPPVNDNTPADQPPAEDQEPDLSGLNKDQLTYLVERYTAEEKYAISQNDPNLKDITRVKESAVKALADLAAKDAASLDGSAPADADKPADATPPADAAKKPAEKPAKKKPATKSPANKSTAPAKPADDAAAKDKFSGGKTTGEFNNKAPAPSVKAPAQNKPAQLGGSTGRHHTGTGHTTAKSVINREQKKAASPK